MTPKNCCPKNESAGGFKWPEWCEFLTHLDGTLCMATTHSDRVLCHSGIFFIQWQLLKNAKAAADVMTKPK